MYFVFFTISKRSVSFACVFSPTATKHTKKTESKRNKTGRTRSNRYPMTFQCHQCVLTRTVSKPWAGLEHEYVRAAHATNAGHLRHPICEVSARRPHEATALTLGVLVARLVFLIHGRYSVRTATITGVRRLGTGAFLGLVSAVMRHTLALLRRGHVHAPPELPVDTQQIESVHIISTVQKYEAGRVLHYFQKK